MITFSSAVLDAARTAGIGIGDAVEPFARIPYTDELAVKRAGIARFLRDVRIGDGVVDEIVAAARPRGYRTTSRRRIGGKGRPTLEHGDGSDARGASPLEPEEHGRIYATIERLLGAASPFTVRALNHVILRGTYDEHVLIVNVRELDASVVRTVRRLAEQVRTAHPTVLHAWIYHDPKGSRYYLDLERPATGVGAKKLFGAAAWRQDVGGVSYQVGVFSFSQVNLAMTLPLVETVRTCAAPTSDNVLFDLYCGYGLFGAAMAGEAGRVVAVDADEATVDNARYNVRRAGGQVTALRQVIRAADDVETVLRTLAKISRRDPGDAANIVVLDPPRAGTGPRVIAAVAEGLRPVRVVEVFCGPEELGRSIKEWKQNGYRLTRLVPVDLFPGTVGMEFVAAFEPGVSVDVPAPSRRPQRSGVRTRR
jgi:tRNA/tmRNA/rRNA uracil-C5-methylase (TrmA/RlmC/RlmD family)